MDARMMEEVKQLVCALREYARLCSIPFCWWRPIDGTEILMDEAAKLIENLCAVLESEERRYRRDEFATLAAKGVKLEADRDAWKRRAEAIECDLHSSINHLDNRCELCAHNQPCGEGICPQYIGGVGVTGHPDWEWSCMGFEFGTCPALVNTPCQGCVLGNHWQWRGPCAENGDDKR